MGIRIIRQKNSSWKPSEQRISVSEPYAIRSEAFSERLMENLLSNIDFRLDSNFIVFGMKDISILRQIKRRMTNDSNLIVIEICNGDEILIEDDYKAFTNVFCSDNAVMIIGDSEHIQKKFVNIVRMTTFNYNMSNTKVLTMPYLKSKYPMEIQHLFQAFFDQMHSLAKLYGNAVSDTLLGSDNFIGNWSYYIKSVHATAYGSVFRDRPCVIVGAGPSLDKNIDQLHDMRGQTLIIAVDAALDTLLDHGIKPDIVATIERSEKTLKFYRNHDELDDIVLLAPHMIMSDILERFKHRIATGRQEDDFVREFTAAIGRESLDIGFNAAHLPFAFARHLGCSPIVFTGVDLAYTGGKTHTDNVAHNIEGTNQYLKKDNIVHVKGQNGEVLETLNYFMYAKRMFESYMLNNPELRYINATEGGVNIVGAENMTLMQVIELTKNQKVEPYEFLKITQSLEATSDAAVEEMSDAALRFLTDLDRQFRYVEQQCKKALKGLKNLGPDFTKQIRKHSKLGFDFDKDLQIPFFFLQTLIVKYNRDLRSFPIQPDEQQRQTMILLSKAYYEEVLQVVEVIKDHLQRYQETFSVTMKPEVATDADIE